MARPAPDPRFGRLKTAGAGLILTSAFSFVARAAPAPALSAAVIATGQGLCVTRIGPNETPCHRLILSQPRKAGELTVEADGGEMVFEVYARGPYAAHSFALTVTGMRKGPSALVAADGSCSVELSPNEATADFIDCDTFSTFGEIRARFAKAR